MVERTTTKDMLGRSELLAVDKARAILMDNLREITLQTETIPLEQAFNRVLAKTIYSPEDLPAQARSTMDGFAVRAADTFGASQSMPCYLNITGEVAMGIAPSGEVKKGCCHKIPTGGLLPPGADAVVMLEHSVPVDDTMIEIVKSVGSGTNLIQKGEDIAHNQPALQAGQTLRPQDIGLLAGLGINQLSAFKKVTVAILATGDEIIHHAKSPKPGQIRNINSLALAGLVLQAGGEYTDYGIVSDKQEFFLPILKQAVAENDMVLFSGGSSVGIRDLGEQVIEALGPPGILVHGVTLKPGKPILIGMCDNTPIFGLPGHPVSAMVCFDFFVKDAVDKLSGKAAARDITKLSLGARLTRNINSAPGRRDVVRVKIFKTEGEWQAEPIMGKSGSISTLSRAHGYFLIGEESQGVTENTVVEVFLYQ